ncbi:hypothetical protein EVD19_02150 [Elizabethkingia meningoseptica]|nr:hypothetical protein EVD19_02150 [Elizabethkingia meningoseptica]
MADKDKIEDNYSFEEFRNNLKGGKSVKKLYSSDKIQWLVASTYGVPEFRKIRMSNEKIWCMVKAMEFGGIWILYFS